MSTMIELDWKLKRKIQKNFSKVSENMLATTSEGNFYTIPTKYRCGDLDDRTDNYVLEIMGNKEENTMDYYKIRKLTPVECERLQAFPDGWTEYGMNGELISDTQRYKCLGNAVTTTVITAIVNEVFKDYEEH